MFIFEAHITVKQEDLEFAYSLLDSPSYSSKLIEGDPILGSGRFGYLTHWANSYEEADKNNTAIVRLLNLNNVKVLREKIEFVLKDIRY